MSKWLLKKQRVKDRRTYSRRYQYAMMGEERLLKREEVKNMKIMMMTPDSGECSPVNKWKAVKRWLNDRLFFFKPGY
jgi:hypothetical protein